MKKVDNYSFMLKHAKYFTYLGFGLGCYMNNM